MNDAPPNIAELIQRFRDHYDAYTSPQYNETQAGSSFRISSNPVTAERSA